MSDTLIAYIKSTEGHKAADLHSHATACAWRWRESCYVYMVSAGVVVFSQGPDADYPKRVPSFVVEYERKKVAA